MLLSIANARPRNIESTRVSELVPSYFRNDAADLLKLIHSYYDFLNQDGLPSREINAISTLNDIDRVSSKYFDSIQGLIGKTVPNSRVMNRVELYKLIVKYYNNRGSDDSVHTFFKIFFDQIVTLFYPKDFLFDLSNGTGEWIGDEFVYTEEKSLLSDRFKINDGYFWQDFSYVLRTDLDSSAWLNEYLRFVHPAGLKLFIAIVIEIVSRNEWYNELDYTNDNAEWLNALVPPYVTNKANIGFHTPRFQPGWLRDRLLRFVFTYLRPGDEDLVRLTFVCFKIIAGGGAIDVRNSFVRHRYQIEEKFIDTCTIGDGWLNKTIADAIEPYSNSNACRMLNFSSIITARSTYYMSSYNIDAQTPDVDWEESLYDTDAQTPELNWEFSKYEEV